MRIAIGAALGVVLSCGVAAAGPKAKPAPVVLAPLAARPGCDPASGKWAKPIRKHAEPLRCASVRYVDTKLAGKRVLVIVGVADDADQTGRALLIVNGKAVDGGPAGLAAALGKLARPTDRLVLDLLSVALIASAPDAELAYSSADAQRWTREPSQAEKLAAPVGFIVTDAGRSLKAYARTEHLLDGLLCERISLWELRFGGTDFSADSREVVVGPGCQL